MFVLFVTVCESITYEASNVLYSIRIFNPWSDGQGRCWFKSKLEGERILSACVCMQKLAFLGPAVCLRYLMEHFVANARTECDGCTHSASQLTVQTSLERCQIVDLSQTVLLLFINEAYTRTRAHTHTRMHTRTHARAQTQTHAYTQAQTQTRARLMNKPAWHSLTPLEMVQSTVPTDRLETPLDIMAIGIVRPAYKCSSAFYVWTFQYIQFKFFILKLKLKGFEDFRWKFAGTRNLSTCICMHKLAFLRPTVCLQYVIVHFVKDREKNELTNMLERCKKPW